MDEIELLRAFSIKWSCVASSHTWGGSGSTLSWLLWANSRLLYSSPVYTCKSLWVHVTAKSMPFYGGGGGSPKFIPYHRFTALLFQTGPTTAFPIHCVGVGTLGFECWIKALRPDQNLVLFLCALYSVFCVWPCIKVYTAYWYNFLHDGHFKMFSR